MDTHNILAELRAERERIDQAISALEALGSDSASARRTGRRSAGAGATRGRRHMSAATRKRISEMMKQRWAERKRRAAKAA
jgi:hypothetical protein